MKTKIVALLLLIVAFLPAVIVVHAPLSTLGTGYAVTSNYHGVEVPIGNDVTVTAYALDLSVPPDPTQVTQVTFRWNGPPDGNGPPEREVTVAIADNGTTWSWNNGTVGHVLYAQDVYAPLSVGDYGVQVFFQDETGSTRADVENVIKIKATSFNVTPEIPFGTIGAIAMMMVALALVTMKRKAYLPFKP